MKLRHGTPEEAGITPKTLEIIRERVQEWVEQSKEQGMVFLAARRGVIFIDEAFGSFSPEPESPALSKDALFPLASLSKPITATALMLLVEAGLVGLNRPVQEYIPEFDGEGKEAVLVHQLLTHTSGQDDRDIEALMEKEGEPADLPDPDATLHPQINKILYFMLRAPLWKMPGEEMAYSDTNFYLAGEIVRRVSGRSLGKFAFERIFKPLGMLDTGYAVPEGQQVRVVQRPEDAPAYHYQTLERMARPSPSSGVYSTASDMAALAQMFLNAGRYGKRRILSPVSVNAMTRNQIPGISARILDKSFLDSSFPEASWGFGWSIAHPYKSRFYGEALPSPGYICHTGFGGINLWFDPTLDLLGVYFSIALDVDDNNFPLSNGDLFMNVVTAGVRRSAFVIPAFGHEISNEARNLHQLPDEAAQPPFKPLELRVGTADEAGIAIDRLHNVVAQAEDWVESGLYPSLEIVATRKGVVFLHEVFGRLGIEDDDPELTVNTIFPLASITKLISAVAVMILVDEGLVGLNRPVQDYAPKFRGDGKSSITVRQLLTHTSGMTDEAVVQQAIESGWKIDPSHEDRMIAELIRDYDRLLDLIYATPLSHPPNSLMSYSGMAYTLVGEVLKRASKMGIAEFIQQRIFEPLGMHDSYMVLPESEGSRLVRKPAGAPGSVVVPTIVKERSISPTGGAFSTAQNMAIFGQMFLNGGTYNGQRILSPASVAAMTRNQIPGIPAVSGEETFPEGEWGFGWSVHLDGKSFAYDEALLSQRAFSHGGAGGTFLWVDPTYDLVVTFFSVYLRFKQNHLPDANHDLFINALIASIVGK